MSETNPSIIATVDNNAFLKAVNDFKARQSSSIKKDGPDYPAIAIVGGSGTGKTASLRKLPPKETAIINVEGKALSFKSASEFEDYHFSNFTEYTQVNQAFDLVAAAPNIKYIVLDSFTKWGELLYNLARKTKQGWDIQNMNNDMIFELLEKIKKVKNKFVIVIGIDEIVSDATVTGATVRARRMAVSGKKWESKIEKEFTCVLYTEVKPVMGQAGKFEYKFLTNTDGTCSAKSPEGMFPQYIDNDIKLVCDTAAKYYGLKV